VEFSYGMLVISTAWLERRLSFETNWTQFGAIGDAGNASLFPVQS